MIKMNKTLNIKSMKSELETLKKSLLNFNFQKSTGQLEKTSEIRKTKRKIATIKTKLNQEKVEQNA